MIRFLYFATAAALFAAGGTPCAKLTEMAIPNVTVTEAKELPAAQLEVPGGARVAVPAFCRVWAVARPVADSEIHMEFWLPERAAWNGKFLGTGNGGYSSALSYAAMANALRLGYATAGHDTGHTGTDMRFGLGHPEKVADYAYRAVHTMTTTAKLLVRTHIGRHAERSYFSSCSAGGHQAMSEVQRYPEDYDGVIAGAPANNRVRQTFAFLWSWLSMHDAGGAPLLGLDELKLVTKAVVASCDAADGLKDGLVEDPRRCAFDPAQLACKPGQAAGQCLKPAQVEGMKKVYTGLRNPQTGEQLFTGWPKGSEAFGDAPGQGWRGYLLDPKEPMRIEALRYFLFHDPNWDWRTIEWNRDMAFAERELAYLSATQTDLGRFARRGGKLILYAGWADPIVPPGDTIQYYEAVTRAMGGPQKTQEFARLFVAPGMGHCSGGPGPNTFDALTALDQWVTKGKAPEQIVASHETNGKVDRTRPLCPYPQVARYKGAGSVDEAANFRCVQPPSGVAAGRPSP